VLSHPRPLTNYRSLTHAHPAHRPCSPPLLQAIGEPPFFLAASAFFAIKEALRSARAELGVDTADDFVFHSPASSERIRMAVPDQFVARLTGGAAADVKAASAFQTHGSY
jgi:hypothetical protein